MATCTNNHLAPSTSYKRGCRCTRCLEWKKEASNRTNNKELAKERSRLWRLTNLERSRANAKRYQKENPHKVFEFQLKKYGISPLEYNSLLEKQNGVCYICKQTCCYKTRLSVDHNHKTGKVRGLLCGNCNTGLGKFKESKRLLEEAIKYLEENGDVYE